MFAAVEAIANACSCVSYPTTCEKLAKAEVAFVGLVTQGTYAEGVADPHRGFGERPAVVSVETIVRGLPAGTREVQVDPAVGTSCYFPLKAGERHLVLGSMRPGAPAVVLTGTCMSGALVRPENDELRGIIASYMGGPTLFLGDTRLYKSWDSKYRDDALLAEVDVKLSGKTREWSARTDASGRFMAEGLPPGEYVFSAVKHGLSAEVASTRSFEDGQPPDKIVMPERGCVQAPVMMYPDTRISGRVRRADGQAVAGVQVFASEWAGNGSVREKRTAKTDEQGRFTISRLMPGQYVVGMYGLADEDGEYAKTFHPASPAAAGATQITIADGTQVDGADIVVPLKRVAVTVRVKVEWPDKRPVPHAMIDAEHPERGSLTSARPKPEEMRTRFTDFEGFATVRLYEGVAYTFSAWWLPPEARTDPTKRDAFHRTGRVVFVPAQDAIVTLTLNETPAQFPKR